MFCAPLGTGAANPPPPPPPPPVVMNNKQHAPKCGCGCVPNIMSLFEMAELRKQARLKRQQQQSQPTKPDPWSEKLHSLAKDHS